MKKIPVILLALLMMLCAARTAYADAIVSPIEGIMRYALPVFLIGLAVLIVIIIIKNIRNR